MQRCLPCVRGGGYADFIELNAQRKSGQNGQIEPEGVLVYDER